MIYISCVLFIQNLCSHTIIEYHIYDRLGRPEPIMAKKIENIENLFFETYELETTEITKTYRTDLRTTQPDVFKTANSIKWRTLKWEQIGKPITLKNVANTKKKWEQKNAVEMPEIVQWRHYNRIMHELFNSDLSEISKVTRRKFLSKLKRFKFKEADSKLQKLIHLKLWYNIHHKDDAIWDPRGKRALFENLEVEKPRILVLGAADGYDGMILASLYPDSEIIMVDFDDFCLTDRFGKFPEKYPFIARHPKTGYWNVFNKSDFNIHFEINDILNLKYGKEFDIILSSGLIEHYPDKYKPLIFHVHRQFLKPNGYAILTSMRNGLKMRTFFHLIGDLLNYSYHELMDLKQLGLYAHENGFKVLKASYIKGHNSIVTQAR